MHHKSHYENPHQPLARALPVTEMQHQKLYRHVMAAELKKQNSRKVRLGHKCNNVKDEKRRREALEGAKVADKQMMNLGESITLIKSKLVKQAVSVKDPPRDKQAKASRAKLLREELALYEKLRAEVGDALP
jgi:hypothetical protein